MPHSIFCPKCNKKIRSLNHLCEPNAIAQFTRLQALRKRGEKPAKVRA